MNKDRSKSTRLLLLFTIHHSLLHKEAFPPESGKIVVFVGEEVEGGGLGSQALVLEDCGGVGGAEEMGIFCAIFFCYEVVDAAHDRGARGEVVGVGGEEVDPAVVEETVGHTLGFFAHLSEDGAGGDLNKEAVAEPVGEPFGSALEGEVALGVGEDVDHAGGTEVVEGFAHAGSEDDVGQLDEEIAAGVDGVASGVGVGIFDVVVGEMEVAAGAERERDGLGGESGAEIVEARGGDGGVEGPVGAGVWSADDVSDAVGRGHACHGEGGREVGRAVI